MVSTETGIIQGILDELRGESRYDFVAHYELPRIKAIYRIIDTFSPADGPVRLLNIGFLTGIVPYTLLRLDSNDRLFITSTERRGAENWKQLDETSVRVQSRGRHELVDLDLDLVDEDGTLRGWESAYGTYHWVVLGEVIEHIPSIYAPRILRFFHHLLVDGGRLIITTPNLHGIKMRIRHLLGVDFTHDPLGNSTMGYPHINLFSSRQICDLSRANRFRVVEVEYRDFTSGPRIRGNRALTLSGLMERIRVSTCSRLFPSTCDDLVICMQKSNSVQSTSPIYGVYNAGLRDGLRSVKLATRTNDDVQF